jgi:hypothetical protein
MILKSNGLIVFENHVLSASEVKAVPGLSLRVIYPSREVAAIAIISMGKNVVMKLRHAS